MTKFGSIKKNFDPTGRTAWFDLPFGDGARIKCRHAGRSNKGYTNAIVKAMAKSGDARKAAQGQIDSKLLDANLNLDRDVFPRHVIIEWEKIPTDDGSIPVFSEELCREFLYDLPDWIMQEISTWAGRPMNFLPDNMPTEEEVEDQAGN